MAYCGYHIMRKLKQSNHGIHHKTTLSKAPILPKSSELLKLLNYLYPNHFHLILNYPSSMLLIYLLTIFPKHKKKFNTTISHCLISSHYVMRSIKQYEEVWHNSKDSSYLIISYCLFMLMPFYVVTNKISLRSPYILHLQYLCNLN